MKTDRIVEIGFKVSLAVAMFILMTWLMIIQSPTMAYSASGAAANQTLNTTVNITNAAPEVRSVTIDTPINLEAYGEVIVNCSAVIFDWDNDTLSVNATFFNNASTTVEGALDNNTRYVNTTCARATPQDRLMNYTCTFNVQYYADNSTHWVCNVTARDDENATDTNVSSQATINPLVAIYIPPTVLDFGSMRINDISSDKLANITNAGNRNLTISVTGYGATPGDNNSMNCSYGVIPMSYMRYNTTSGRAFDTEMKQLTNESTLINDYYMEHRFNDTGIGESTNTTYWKLKIPPFAGGICTGKLIFTAGDRGT